MDIHIATHRRSVDVDSGAGVNHYLAAGDAVAVTENRS